MGFFRYPEYRISIPGIQDRDFLFWARSKNPGIPLKNPEIPEKKARENPEKIPSEKKSQNQKR